MNETDFTIQLHNKLCELVDLFLYYYNPCKIEGNKCAAADPNPCCINSRFGKGTCPFMGANGCRFQNIDCKLWLCETAIKGIDEKCLQAFKLIEETTKLYGLAHRPYIGSPYVGADKQI